MKKFYLRIKIFLKNIFLEPQLCCYELYELDMNIFSDEIFLDFSDEFFSTTDWKNEWLWNINDEWKIVTLKIFNLYVGKIYFYVLF